MKKLTFDQKVSVGTAVGALLIYAIAARGIVKIYEKYCCRDCEMCLKEEEES